MVIGVAWRGEAFRMTANVCYCFPVIISLVYLYLRRPVCRCSVCGEGEACRAKGGWSVSIGGDERGVKGEKRRRSVMRVLV